MDVFAMLGKCPATWTLAGMRYEVDGRLLEHGAALRALRDREMQRMLGRPLRPGRALVDGREDVLVNGGRHGMRFRDAETGEWRSGPGLPHVKQDQPNLPGWRVACSLLGRT